MTATPLIEHHPWPPFLPKGAKVLIMGTFPPGSHRWNMDFYYPNLTNDFWKIMGLVLLGDKDALMVKGKRCYDEPAIRTLMERSHIALSDTARAVRRLQGNASDKFLEILEPAPLDDLLARIPDCHHLATTGQKAAEVVASITSTPVPAMGEWTAGPDCLHIWRMPSSSRAYPMKMEVKAEFYRRLLLDAGVIAP